MRFIKTRSVTAVGFTASLAALLVGCTTGTASTSNTTGPSADGSSTAGIAGIGDLSPVPISTIRGVDAGAAKGHSLNLPEGWTADVWANIPTARMAASTPDDRLVVSAAGGGSLALITPASTSGAARVTTLIDGLDNPQGVAFTEVDNRTVLVVGQETSIDSWTYADGRLSDHRTLVDDLPGGGHGSKFVAIHDGLVVYNVGSETNRDASDRTATPERATLAQVGLDGSGNHTIATGVRNGEGLSYAPDGSLYVAVNQADEQPYPFRDGTGLYGQTDQSYVNEHPNDQISPITPGTELGWPYCVPDSRGSSGLRDLGYVDDPTSNSDGKALDCAALPRTQLGLPAHSAPVGFVFTQGSKLPNELSSGALITAHGSWNRQPPREPYVAYSAWDDSTNTLTTPRALVTGFQDGAGERWGRSVDAVPGPDGGIYLTDDQAGLVYRLSPPSN